MSRNRKDWTYINLYKSQMRNVEVVVEHATAYGTKKYRSRNEFVTKAVEHLLEQEFKRMPSLELIA